MLSKFNNVHTPNELYTAILYYLIMWTGSGFVLICGLFVAIPLIIMAMLPFCT